MTAEELDPLRLADFSQRLSACSGQRIRQEELWSAFAAAFPTRPQGREERQLLLRALEELARRQVIILPPIRGRRWDRTIDVAVPTTVDKARAPLPERSRTWIEFPWHDQLRWAADLVRLSDENERFLRRVHEGLVNGWFTDKAPFKYRSLQLTGDEKRLGELVTSALFGPGRLDLDLLGCLGDILPLATERVSERPSVVIFENAAPFMVARDVLREFAHPPYGLIGYGGGTGVLKTIGFLATITPSVQHIDYVGDLDFVGLRIASGFAEAAARAGLPRVCPAIGLHAAMLDSARRFGYDAGWPDAAARDATPSEIETAVTFLCQQHRRTVAEILERRQRIPEEVLGPQELRVAWNA